MPNLAQDRPVRVAHLIYDLRIGGMEKLVVELADRCRKENVEPLVIALGLDGPVREMLEARNIPTEYLSRMPGLAPTTLAKLHELFAKHDIDVAHGHDIGPWLNAAAVRTVRPKMEVVATFHQIATPNGIKRPAALFAARASKALVACGDEVLKCMKTWVPDSANVITIGNGVGAPPAGKNARVAARAQLELPEGATVLGYIGRFHHEKGPDLLVEAFLSRYANRPDVQLVMVGWGPLEEELRRRAATVSNLHVKETVLDATVLYAGFDVYCQPSRREGRSMSMLEAMAAGLPTVAHDLPAVTEVHDPDKTALLVPPEDVKALGDALDRLVADPALRRRLGEAAKVKSQTYSIDNTAKAYAQLYREKAQGKA